VYLMDLIVEFNLYFLAQMRIENKALMQRGFTRCLLKVAPIFLLYVSTCMCVCVLFDFYLRLKVYNR